MVFVDIPEVFCDSFFDLEAHIQSIVFKHGSRYVLGIAHAFQHFITQTPHAGSRSSAGDGMGWVWEVLDDQGEAEWVNGRQGNPLSLPQTPLGPHNLHL